MNRIFERIKVHRNGRKWIHTQKSSIPSADSVRSRLSPHAAHLLQEYPSLLSVDVHWGDQDVSRLLQFNPLF